jgi:muconolactone delta-isomerase
MRVLALEKDLPGVLPGSFGPHLKAEARHVWELLQAGIVRDIWFTATDHNAVIMLECESPEEAERILAAFPLVQAGLIRFEILPLVAYDGFVRLFETQAQPFSDQ